jgi:4-diphosphocytidyl-2-C-methyl-D-erythritol kinase
MAKIKSYVKVNLSIKILDFNPIIKKHKLESVFLLYKKEFEKIKIIKSNQLQIFYVEKSQNKIIKIENDLVYKICKYFQERYKKTINYKIYIFKKIPYGSGLGAGSSNAAYVLKYFIKKFRIDLKSEELEYIAQNIGSDIPFFLSNYKTALVYSYGEKVKKISSNWKIIKVIVNSLNSETKLVYNKFSSLRNRQKNSIDKFIKGCEKPFNDLQESFFLLNPDYQNIFNSIIISDNAEKIVSGSGSAFVIFKRKRKLWK